MLNIYSSSRTEYLAQILATRLGLSKTPWNEKEVVLVQGKGMERWLNLQLADANGISGNIDFAFPKSFVTRILKQSGVLADGSLIDRDTIAWKILALLPELEGRPSFSVIKNYIQGKGNDGLRRYQLAMKLADIFDNYFLFRPEMTAYWSAGSPVQNRPVGYDASWDKFPWQAELWRELFPSDACFFTQALSDFIAGKGDFEKVDLPMDIHLFGFSTLAPIMVRFFKKLSEYSSQTVNLYLFSPCQEYWADLKTEKQVLNQLLKGDEEHWEFGNPLLASMGILGRDFLKIILDEAGEAYQGNLEMDEGEGYNLLTTIQDDILHFKTPSNEEVKEVEVGDRSIIVNSCHSPAREVEVLYDHILDLLNSPESSDLLDANILVMAPDIKEYAPYIETIFGSPEKGVVGQSKIPFTIADGSLVDESKLARVFLSILSLVNSRLTSMDLLGIFENEVVYRNFGLVADDVLIVRNLVKKARICWGEDDSFRANTTTGAPAFKENSWQFGLERLLLGYAMPSSVASLSDDETAIYPVDLEGNEPAILGKFITFVKRVFKTVKKLKQQSSRSGIEWQTIMNIILVDFFVQDKETTAEVIELRKIFGKLPSQLEKAGVSCELELAVVMSWLNSSFSDESAAHGFLQRGITFCKLLPMRSIPAKVICILGLNDGVFPRSDRKVSFDLVATDLKPGDRSSRKDDRYLFLETLMATRETLYLSYIGRSIKDNSEIPPSVLLSELLDYIGARFGEVAAENLVTHHPLQPFNKRYFVPTDPQLFSYSQENALASQLLQNRSFEAEPFIKVDYKINLDEPLKSTLESGSTIVELDDFLKFFKNPAKYYLNKCLKVFLRLPSEELPDENERFEAAKGLEGYALKAQLFDSLMADEEESYHKLNRQGELPVGAVGEVAFETVKSEVSQFVEKLKEAIDVDHGFTKQPLEFDIDIDGIRLRGRLEDIYRNDSQCKQVCYHMGKDNGARRLKINILQTIALLEDISETKYLYVDKTKADEIDFVKTKPQAKTKLKAWLHLYFIGQNQPLVFFPSSSPAFAKEDQADGVLVEAALGKAMDKWLPSDFNFYADASNDEIVRCFGLDFPGLDDNYRSLFIETANAVYDVCKEEGENNDK